MTALLEVKNLHIAFGHTNKKSIVKGINLTINESELVALVGESGSGKSVTAMAICGLLGHSGTIVEGQVWFEGKLLYDGTSQPLFEVRGKKIGMIFQDPMTALNPTMKVGTQIAEMLVLHEKLSWKQAQESAVELMHGVGIADPRTRSKSYPFQLSGGLRQRVMIAIALAGKPRLLIADEPTTALDVTIQAQILDLLQDICSNSQMGLLLITHDLAVVANLCSKVAVMQHGTIVETASTETLFQTPQHRYTQMLLEACHGFSTYAHS